MEYQIFQEYDPQGKYQSIEFGLPDKIEDLDLEKLIGAILNCSEEMRQLDRDYLIVFDHEDLSQAQDYNWISAFQGILQSSLIQISMSKKIAYYTFNGMHLNQRGQYVMNFPLKLFISNNVDLIIRSYQETFLIHCSGFVEISSYEKCYQQAIFDLDLYKAYFTNKLSLLDFQKFNEEKPKIH